MPARSVQPTGDCSLVVFLCNVAASLVPLARQGPAPAPRPGPQGGGVTLLSNGWRIAPAGTHRQIGDLPLAMVASPDGRFLVVTNNGYAKPTLTLVDLERGEVRQRLSLDHAC